MSFWGHESVAKIDADRAAREVEQGAQLIDVGEPDEWFAGHLPHAILVEPELVDRRCTSSPRTGRWWSRRATPSSPTSVAATLHDHGFDVAMIEGGIGAWKAAGHPLIKADGSKA